MHTDLEKIQNSCNYFGIKDTSYSAMEECSELIQCITKELRGTKDPSHMEEEIGDVLISLSNLIYIYGLDEEASVRELARLLGGDTITDAVITNAREMRKMAADSKN